MQHRQDTVFPQDQAAVTLILGAEEFRTFAGKPVVERQATHTPFVTFLPSGRLLRCADPSLQDQSHPIKLIFSTMAQSSQPPAEFQRWWSVRKTVALGSNAFLSGEYDLRQRPLVVFKLLLWFSRPGSQQSQQSAMFPPGAPEHFAQPLLGLCQLGM
jgi:hypothetical protein